jgi:hypothetical protein
LNYYPKAIIAVPFTPVPGSRLLAVDAHARHALAKAVIEYAQKHDLSSLHLLFGDEEDDLQACTEAGMMLRHTVQFHWHNNTYLDFDDFLKQSELVTKMGSFAGVAKMLPGIGGQISNAQIKEVEIRLKRSKALICSMTKKERANPDLLITDRTARSRLRRITTGSGLSLDQGVAFVSEFQKMRTMMSRMQKSMGMMPQGDTAAEMAEDMPMAAGNRAMRRAAKKQEKPGRGGGKGFGK